MASYTMVIVPLRNDINTLDALHFFLWVKKLRDLEREKDLLLMGLQALEQLRYKLLSHPEDISITGELQSNFRNGEIRKESSYASTLSMVHTHRLNWTSKNLVSDTMRPVDSFKNDFK